MDNQNFKKNLITNLSKLYSDANDIKRILTFAKIEHRKFDMTSSSVNIWTEIISGNLGSEKLKVLSDVILEEYPAREDLFETIKQFISTSEPREVIHLEKPGMTFNLEKISLVLGIFAALITIISTFSKEIPALHANKGTVLILSTVFIMALCTYFFYTRGNIFNKRKFWDIRYIALMIVIPILSIFVYVTNLSLSEDQKNKRDTYNELGYKYQESTRHSEKALKAFDKSLIIDPNQNKILDIVKEFPPVAQSTNLTISNIEGIIPILKDKPIMFCDEIENYKLGFFPSKEILGAFRQLGMTDSIYNCIKDNFPNDLKFHVTRLVCDVSDCENVRSELISRRIKTAIFYEKSSNNELFRNFGRKQIVDYIKETAVFESHELPTVYIEGEILERDEVNILNIRFKYQDKNAIGSQLISVKEFKLASFDEVTYQNLAKEIAVWSLQSIEGELSEN